MVLMVLINFGSFRTTQTLSCRPSATLRSWAFAPYPKARAGTNSSDRLILRATTSNKATAADHDFSTLTPPPIVVARLCKHFLSTCAIVCDCVSLLIAKTFPKNRKCASPLYSLGETHFRFGGDKGSRTPDLLNAIETLYQLSYIPNKKEVARIISYPRAVVNGELSRSFRR